MTNPYLEAEIFLSEEFPEIVCLTELGFTEQDPQNIEFNFASFFRKRLNPGVVIFF